MKIILGLSMTIVFATIMAGVVLKNKEAGKEKLKKILKWNLIGYVPLMLLAIGLLVPDMAFAAAEDGIASASGMGFIAAALSTGFATIGGAGYAVGAVGSSALGAVSEDPKILGKTLIFVGLAEGIAIYGLIISILILGRL